MALLDDLQTAMSSPFLDMNVNWKQYVYDHRMYLRANANRIVPSGERLVSCRYNLQRWLREEGYDPTIWWIVLLLNGMKNDLDFDSSWADKVIYVPTGTQMNTAYLSYLTTSATRVTNPIGQ